MNWKATPHSTSLDKKIRLKIGQNELKASRVQRQLPQVSSDKG